MLITAVTGGIGSGKSTVSRRLVSHGALLVDSDVLAREVVAPGTAGLAAIAAQFGAGVLTADGALDRAAMAAVVFNDPESRQVLNGITHPLVRARFAEIVAAAPTDAVIVNDIPLLTTVDAAAAFALVIGVGAEAELRVHRLINRGLSEGDARARMRSQITDDERKPLADHWIDNDGSERDVDALVDELWSGRVAVMADNLLTLRPAVPLGPPLDTAAIERVVARVRRVAGGADVEVQDATGPLRLELSTDLEASSLAVPMLTAGFVPQGGGGFAGTDPDQPVTIEVRSRS